MEKSVEDLEKEITCAICHDHYTEPKVLPCCHYYCKQCICRLALMTGIDKPFSCPECRKDTTLPQGCVDDLPTAFFVNRLKQMYSKFVRAHGKVDAKCEMCSGDKAEAFCRKCAQFICAECVKSHQRMKIFVGHKTATLDELRDKEMTIEEPSFQACKVHEQPMNVYCFDCSCLICRDCTIKVHRGHNYDFIKTAAQEMKKKLTQQLDPLKNVKMNLSCAMDQIQTTKSEIETQGHSVAKHIECSFDELNQIIEHCKQSLLGEVATKVSQKLEHLSGQEKSLSTACAVVQSVIEYTEQCVEYSADDEVMCMHAEIQDRIDREIEEQHKEVNNLEPVEEADIGVEVNCVEDLKQLCQTKAKITNTINRFEGVKNAEVSKMSESSIIFKSKRKPTERQCTPECHLKSLVSGSTTKCQVDRIKSYEYRIKYTPTVRGPNELIMAVNGQEVAGSPFPVFVSIHPTKLGKPVRVIPQLARPAGVAINSEGEIIVAEWNGDVVTLDREGKRLRSIKRTDHDLKHPRGVAVDEEDNVYFIDQEVSNIYKCDKKNMTLCMTKIRKKIEHKKLTGYLCVTVIRDEVMACERDNKGTITVYNKELEYAREITPLGMNPAPGTFTSISSDEHGNLYVSDVSNHHIHVLNNGGDLLHSFGCGECPHGICVAGQYVYVANHYGHNNVITVFTTAGEYVTSFGRKGSNEGDFEHPLGVCVDKDGFVYVCDCSNDRIQMF